MNSKFLRKNSSKILIVVLSAIALVVVTLICFFSFASNENTTINIDSSCYYPANHKIVKSNNDIFIVSYENNKFISSNVDSINKQCTKVYEQTFDEDIIGFDIENGILYIATYMSDSALSIYAYDINNGYSPISQTYILCDNFLPNDCFVADREGNFIILLNDYSTIKKYFSDGVLIANCVCDVKLNSILKSPNGKIYFEATENDCIITIQDNALIKYTANSLEYPVSFLENDIVIDKNGNVFNISDNISYLFNTACNNNTACIYNENLLSFCCDRLLLIDINSQNELGQFNIDSKPNQILCNENAVIAFSETDDTISAEIIDSYIKPVEYTYLDENDNAFLAQPCGIYSVDKLNNLPQWKVIIDYKKLISECRGKLSVDINSKTTKHSCVANLNGDEISFSPDFKLISGDYEIIVNGLCDRNGIPVKLSYYVMARENSSSEVPSSSQSSSETESSEPVSKLIESSVYDIDHDTGFIFGVEAETSVTALKSRLIYSGQLVIYDNNDRVVTHGIVANGYRMYLLQDGIASDNLTVIIRGDVNCNGYINSADLDEAVNYFAYETVLDPVYAHCVDINADGVFDTIDLAMLNDMTK